jgi:hypothetical protein
VITGIFTEALWLKVSLLAKVAEAKREIAKINLPPLISPPDGDPPSLPIFNKAIL